MNKEYNIMTSYFGRYKFSNGIAISRGVPEYYEGERLLNLAPSWDLINYYHKTHNQIEYIRIYNKEVLSNLNPYEIIELVNDKVMLCHEKPHEFCHRHLVADWIYKKTGIYVREYSFKLGG